MFNGSTPLLIPSILFCIALVARATFSFLETSITALRLFKLKEIAKVTKRYTTLFSSLENNPQRVLISILIANSLSDVMTAALFPYIMSSFFEKMNWPSGLGFSLGIAIATIAILIFGEIVPKAIAKNSSEFLLRSGLRLTNILFYALYPLVTILLKFSHFFSTSKSHSSSEYVEEQVASESEIRFLINYIHKKGLIDEEKTEMLQNIFRLATTSVQKIMVFRENIISISAQSSLKQALQLSLSHHFTRMPVYDNHTNTIIGIIHLKDLFAATATEQKNHTIQKLVRPILFVSKATKINQLLKEFQQKQIHMAIVIDGNNHTVGLITLEDILEEIVGDITDEHEESIDTNN